MLKKKPRQRSVFESNWEKAVIFMISIIFLKIAFNCKSIHEPHQSSANRQMFKSKGAGIHRHEKKNTNESITFTT